MVLAIVERVRCLNHETLLPMRSPDDAEELKKERPLVAIYSVYDG